MSIIRLKNNEIDPKAWDELVFKSKGARLFSRYDYLKAVNPEFEAIVEYSEDEYKNAFPLVIKRKYGLKYLVQPVFTQQLQILSINQSPSEEFLIKLGSLLRRFISVRLSVDINTAELLKNLHSFKSINRVSYILDLSSYDYEKGYSKNHKRNIKSANKTAWSLDINDDYESLLTEFIANKRKGIEVSENFKRSFKRLIPFLKSNDDIKVFSAIDENGKRMASALFAGHNDLMTFLLSYSNEKAKKTGIMHALINEWLLKFSEKYKSLDFEGGNIASLARFYSGFGAKEAEFAYLEKYPFPLAYFFK